MADSCSSSVQKIETDLVVVGGGASGLTAAVAAAESGAANVVLLEARRILGGNGVFPSGIFAVGSESQRENGFNTTVDELHRKAMVYTHWKANPKLLRNLMEKSADTISWLRRKGVPLFIFPLENYPNGNATMHYVEGPVKAGKMVVNALSQACEELGVQVLRQTRAKKLLLNARKEVTGVLAESDGQQVTVKARAVIIASGGFAGNRKMIQKYLPTYRRADFYHGAIAHKGDGLRMVQEAGIALEETITLEMMGPHFPWSWPLYPLIRSGTTIWLNKFGQRFTDETVSILSRCEAANTIYGQPGRVCYAVFDERIKQAALQRGMKPREALLMLQSGVGGDWVATINSDLITQKDKGRLAFADNWGEIADWMGVERDVLEKTVKEYNDACANGYDPVFNKDAQLLRPLNKPPYYAIRCYDNILLTHGGIRVNHRMEVLDKDYMPVAGLFAAGVDTGGIAGDTYDAVNMLGHSFGFSVNGGRLAGESAARYVK